MPKVTARFRVRIEGWVTVTREVDAFDPTRADDLHSKENDILDAMGDEAINDADLHLDGDVDETEVLKVEP